MKTWGSLSNTKTHHLPHPEPDQSSPDPHPTLEGPFNIILPSNPRSSKWILSLVSPPKPCMHPPLRHVCYMTRPSHSSWFDKHQLRESTKGNYRLLTVKVDNTGRKIQHRTRNKRFCLMQSRERLYNVYICCTAQVGKRSKYYDRMIIQTPNEN